MFGESCIPNMALHYAWLGAFLCKHFETMNCAVPRVEVKVRTPVLCFLTPSFAWKHSLKVPVISTAVSDSFSVF